MAVRRFRSSVKRCCRGTRVRCSSFARERGCGRLISLWSNCLGLIHITVKLKSLGPADGSYEAKFLVDTGATDSLVPGAELTRIGVLPVGKTSYELADDGSVHEYHFGLAEIGFMDEITAGRVIFGPDTAEPILGVTALESVGITIDPTSHTLKRLPAIPLK